MQDHAAIFIKLASLISDSIREGALPQQITAVFRDADKGAEVNVECFVGTLSQSALHGVVILGVDGCCPDRVDGAGDAAKAEGDGCGGEGAVEHVELLGNGLVGQVAVLGFGRVGDDVEVGVDDEV